MCPRVCTANRLSLGVIHVHLGRRHIGMAHHGLNRVNIGSILKKMGGEGVTQRMRRYIRLNTGLFSIKFNNLPKALAAHGAAAAVGEQPLALLAL